MHKILIAGSLCSILLFACKGGNNINSPTSKNDNELDGKNLKSLIIERKLSVHPDTVFEVFTNPEMMRIWWTETTKFEVDLKPRGKWKIIRSEGENVYTALGEYLEIDKPQLVKYTYAMPQFSPNSDTIEIIIKPDGDQSTNVTFIQTGKDVSNELDLLKQGEISGSEQGWQMAFDIIESSIGKNNNTSK